MEVNCLKEWSSCLFLLESVTFSSFRARNVHAIFQNLDGFRIACTNSADCDHFPCDSPKIKTCETPFIFGCY